VLAVTAATFSFGHGKLGATVPGTNEAVAPNSSGGTPSSSEFQPSISQDGRYVAFASPATNLISGLTSTHQQVYVRDRLNNTTQLVSVSTTGTQGNDNSGQPAISADGRYVSFNSQASNLVSSGAGGQIFVRDLVNGTTQVASSDSSGTARGAGGESAISAEGRYVTFVSNSSSLVSGTTITHSSIFLKDMQTGTVKLLSATSGGNGGDADSFEVSMSCEGRFVSFVSFANDLNTTITNNPSKSTQNVFIADTLNGTLSNITDSVAQGSSMGYPFMTCNGNYVSFTSNATNLVAGDTNSQFDAFVYDRINNTFGRANVSSSGAQANDYTQTPVVSNDGRYVAFESTATNLVSGDTNGTDDIFLHDMQSGTTELITQNSGGTIGNGYSSGPVISSDGRYVVYDSGSTNLVSGYGTSPYSQLFSSQTGTSDSY
jgi:WD40 repeat protein